MKRFMLRILAASLSFGIGALMAAGLGSYPPVRVQRFLTPYEMGKIEAENDIASGKIALKSNGGGPVGRCDYYKEIWSKDYGIEVKAGVGCVVSDEPLENARGYNELQRAEIEKRYGRGVFDKIRQKAQLKYEECVESNFNKRAR